MYDVPFMYMTADSSSPRMRHHNSCLRPRTSSALLPCLFIGHTESGFTLTTYEVEQGTAATYVVRHGRVYRGGSRDMFDVQQ